MPVIATEKTLKQVFREGAKTERRGKWWYQQYATDIEANYPHHFSIAINVKTGEYLVQEREGLVQAAMKKFGEDAKVWIQRVGSR